MSISKKITLSPGFICILAVVYFIDESFVVPLLSTSFVHEMGHMCGIRLSGGNINKLTFQFGGMYAEYDNRYMSYKQEALSAAFGPLFSLVFALIMSLLGRVTKSEISYMSAGISFMIFAFNMLPISVLDGGRILYMLTADKGGTAKAGGISKYVDIIFLLIMWALGIAILLFGHGNIILITLTAAIFILCCKNKKNSVKF